MTPRQRLRLAEPVLLLYWLMLGSGLALYTALRADDAAALVPLWAGAIVGTLLGQLLALANYRAWVAVAVIGLVGFWLLPGYSGLVGIKPWVAVVPAGVCGYWSLGDRGALVAWWFPTMIWMLSILDSIQVGVSDRLEILLGGALAAAFVLFLRLRETRRVALWRAVAATPLAATTRATVLRETPRWKLARGGWTIVTAGLTLVITAWLAPMLWQVESQTTVVVTPRGVVSAPNQPTPAPSYRPQLGTVPRVGMGPIASPQARIATHPAPCCVVEEHTKVTRTRIKEYFDLGRGRDEADVPVPQPPRCRVCRDGHDEDPSGQWAGVPTDGVIATDEHGWQTDRYNWQLDPQWQPHVPVPQGRPELPSAGPQGEWQSSSQPTQVPPWQPSPPQPWRDQPSKPMIGSSDRDAPTATATPTPPVPAGPVPPIAPPAALAPITAPPAATPPLAPITAPPTATPPTPPPATPPTAPAIDHPPAIDQVPSSAAAPANAVPSAPATIAPRPAAANHGATILHWLAVLAAGGLIFQLLALALRPLRRLVTLRHLRRPFWDETVDQRVSNSWQLALVGLRDAGWRATSTEPPRDFARRVGVDGLEQCATILERARHGIGIDAADLSEMTSAAEAAYHSARRKLGPGARAIALVRWPLA